MPSSYCNMIEWDDLEQRYRNIITGDLFKTIEDIPHKYRPYLPITLSNLPPKTECDCEICVNKKRTL
jgi:hypothetical protein